ncbi:MAG: hypothetical protein LBQ90_11980 [Synergistaceae bacterium]|nr:hypothetical protein [Synergistaceae bacterium]
MLSNILASEDINRVIKEKLDITLDADENGHYRTLASIVAFLYYTEEIVEGCTSDNILGCARDLGITQITTMDGQAVETLLDEMRDMGILWKSVGTKIPFYRLRRNNFLRNIGTEDDVFNYLGSLTRRGH